MTGLGRAAMRSIPMTGELTLDLDALRSQIERDRAERRRPFLVGRDGRQ